MDFIKILFIAFITSCDAIRTLSPPVYNPDCPQDVDCTTHQQSGQTSSNNLIYIKSAGPNDTLHYFISSIDGLSVLIVQTDNDVSFSVDWNSYLSGSTKSPPISINGTVENVENVVGLAFTELYMYDDVKGSANMMDATNITKLPFSSIPWDVANIDNQSISVVIQSSNLTDLGLGIDGNLKISYQVFDSDGRFNLLPQLLHTETSSQVEVELVNLKTFPDGFTRYALGVDVATPTTFTTQNITSSLSMDDEYTPGTFVTCHVTMNGKKNDVKDFLMFKPVSYSDPSRSLQNAIGLTFSKVLKPVHNVGGLMDGFYGEDNYIANSFNISFGISDDKNFYTNYLAWTLEIGAGVAPNESFSSLVIALLVVCVAVPGAGLIGGGSYGIYSKFVKKNSSTAKEEKKDPIVDELENDDDNSERF